MSVFNTDSEDFEEIAFDSNDEISYYYGDLNRDEVKCILNDAPIGTFLLRDSTKDSDQKVLCVKEAPKTINNYKIIYKHPDNDEDQSNKNGEEANPEKEEEQTQQLNYYLFGKEDCLFASISSILEFYSAHYLNQSPLIKPAFHHKKVIALHDFTHSDDPSEDLYFRKDELITVVEYTQGNEWWKAVNRQGKTGLIPVPLVRKLKPDEWPLASDSNIFSGDNQQQTQKTENKNNEPENVDQENIRQQQQQGTTTSPNKTSLDERQEDKEDREKKEASSPLSHSPSHSTSHSPSPDQGQQKQRQVIAKVMEDYTPSPYEHCHVALRKGQCIRVLEMKSDGKWLGELPDGKQGLFPFNRVELIRE